MTVSFNGKFFQTQKSLAEQSMKALFSLNHLFSVVSLGITEKLKLFDAMILPILNYGSEIWGFHSAPNVERVYLKFLKQILGVRTQTCTAAVYGELGKVPLSVLRKVRILKYWYNIMKSPDSLKYKLLQSEIETDNCINNWAGQVKSLLSDLGFHYLWNNEDVTKVQLDKVIERLYDHFLQSWFSDLRNSSKLNTYTIYKEVFELEKYLCCISNIKHRIALTRFRCSAHKLNIEEGRYRNIERQERLCTKCNMQIIEDEYHFALVCPFYRDLRLQYLTKYYCAWPTIQKFRNLLSSKQSGVLIKLAKFIYLANEKRENN